MFRMNGVVAAQDGVSSARAEQCQQWLCIYITIPEIEKGPEDDFGWVERVEINEVTIGKNACFT
jgi:hypothetical protein